MKRASTPGLQVFLSRCTSGLHRAPIGDETGGSKRRDGRTLNIREGEKSCRQDAFR